MGGKSMENVQIRKYPRTPHLQGSRLQPGDEDLSQIPFDCIRGKRIVVEEKVDGANCAVSFDCDGQLMLQDWTEPCRDAGGIPRPYPRRK